MEETRSADAGLLLAGRYRLGEAIGRGGMGKVWRAHDEVLHRVVAVKELTAGLYVSEADRAVLHARTQKEARAAARISHPGVVTVHDVLEHDARPWIVMQYVDGPSLADAAKEPGRIDEREAARIGLDVLRALGAAHAAGVLHRDIKPANVLLGRDGRALITDFGIAAIEGDATITRTGEIVGSIDYLAPERVRGHDPGPASDLWSLGATLYTAVEGTSPFRRSSPLSTMQAVVDEEPPAPVRAGRLGPVILALLRKDPAARPSAAEAERMLTGAMEGRAPDATEPMRHPMRVPTQRMAQHAAAHESRRAPELRTAPGSGTASEPYAGESGTAPAAGPAARRRGGRIRTALIVMVLAAVVGGGAGLATQYAGRDGGGGGTRSAGEPEKTPEAEDRSGLPKGWERVEDPEGFGLWVPEGWRRQTDGNQIDYTPDNGRHRIRISIDPAPDHENPYMHMLDMQKNLEKRLPDYRRVQLHPNTFRDQMLSALWEFTWTERTEHPGPRRAIDQMYYEDDGTEYALYMSGPAQDWTTTREQFDIMLRGWRPPSGE
ncbi:serine/threonine-protein kinase [Streptomyces peucetius]|uniref:non-specific serine/threonine protein kinase n=1 Tax=Streptomyces peucetius TaxID=1950 RepID=A0ABY6I9Z5_STRPE|nr:serine/threonine-protein kinase [Streptomyces peucetius]UYQ63826.1 protein kinase [Streptomyces peucetius]